MDRAMLMQAEEPWQVIPHPDVRVETADGRSVAVHAKFLTSESDVLQFVLFDRPTKTDGNIPVVPLFGVPYNSVVAFLRCLYLYPSSFSSSPSTSPCWLPKKEEIEKYGVHLLALSHALRVPWLKLAVVNDLVLTMDNVVDMLKLSQLCDAPELTVRSLSMIRRRFTAVVQTDAWEFVKENDPSLELQVLQFMEDFHKRERRRRRMKKNQVVYTALGEAIECLHHICNDGCTMDEQPNGNINIGSKNGKRPCTWGDTCRNLQRKLRHFANCEANKKKTSAITLVDDNECSHCSRMRHLFCLHSALCHGSGICKVPLCSKFKKSNGLNSNSKEWNLLIKKVSSTIVSTRLSSKRHRFGI